MEWVEAFAAGRSESLIALLNGKFVIMRVPYPIGLFAKGMDGRFDDLKTGWKGKGLWTTWGTRTSFHSETGKEHGINFAALHVYPGLSTGAPAIMLPRPCPAPSYQMKEEV